MVSSTSQTPSFELLVQQFMPVYTAPTPTKVDTSVQMSPRFVTPSSGSSGTDSAEDSHAASSDAQQSKVLRLDLCQGCSWGTKRLLNRLSGSAHPHFFGFVNPWHPTNEKCGHV